MSLVDDTGTEQQLEPALKRALLESGAVFAELMKAAKDWEGEPLNGTRLIPR